MSNKPWWKSDEGQAHKVVFEYVQAVEREQADIYDRFVKLTHLYDPNAPNTGDNRRGNEQLGMVQENVIASNVDTVAAVVASTDIRARFMTDDADWSTQRRAKRLELYAEQIGIDLGVQAKCRLGFKMGAALKGTALVKVYVDQWKQIQVDSVLPDDIIVDERECQNGGKPRQMHQRMMVSREELCAQFPDYDAEIERAQRSGVGLSATNRWAGYRSVENDDVVVVESWRLPFGKRGSKGYTPGRHTITIDGADLLDEEWHKPHFPFAVMRWSERANAWYGISLAERIAGHQRALNKRNWQIDRQLDLGAVPITYVDLADANLAIKAVNRAGTIVPIKGNRPQTVIPPAVSGEIYKSRDDLKQSAHDESGVSRMAAHASKPAGLDSGVALREYRDATTQRFALQEKAFEQFVLDTIVLVLDCCKDLGEAAPTVVRKGQFDRKMIEWSEVDMGEVRVQIQAASTLSRTPAGRTQLVMELAQAGIVSTDTARRLLGHPDLARELSLYTSALEAIEEQIEQIADGEIVVPEPFDNHQMIVWRGQAQYLLWRAAKAPEDVLEALRQYVVLAAHMIASKEKQAANDQAMMAGPTMPALPGGAPANDQAVSAMAPEAMGLVG
jgi:hypothetical protein